MNVKVIAIISPKRTVIQHIMLNYHIVIIVNHRGLQGMEHIWLCYSHRLPKPLQKVLTVQLVTVQDILIRGVTSDPELYCSRLSIVTVTSRHCAV